MISEEKYSDAVFAYHNIWLDYFCLILVSMERNSGVISVSFVSVFIILDVT